MDSRRQFITLAGLLLIIQFAFVGMDHYNLDTTRTQILEDVEAADRAVESLDLARIAEARFKNQVQEWKNILLRGNQPDLFEKYRSQFEGEAEQVRDALARLEVLAGAMPDLDAGRLTALAADHAEMLDGYRSALEGADLSEVAAARAVDASVRGIDRAFTEDLRDLAATLAEKATRLNRTVSDDAVARLDEQKNTELIQLAIASTIIVLLVVVFMVFGRGRRA